MKKTGFIILLVLLTVAVWGCGGTKTPLTADEFTAKMAEAGFEIMDAYDQFEEGTVEVALVAGNNNYQIEFYIVPTEDQAISAFNQNKSTFEDAKGNSSSNTSVNFAHYGAYKMTSGGMYYVISRIDNTFIYVVTDVENKESLNEILKALGY